MLDRDPWTLPRTELPSTDSGRAIAETRLRQAVMGCEILPGAIVSEAKLGERFGLNRAGVRAALIALECHGLVEALPRHGWRVRPILGSYIGDVVSARRAVEQSLMVARLTPAQLARIDEIAQLDRVLSTRAEPSALVTRRAYDRELLDLVFAGAGSIRQRWLREALDHCERLVRFFEMGGGPVLQAADRLPLAKACGDRDDARARQCLDDALGVTEAFFVSALMEQRAEISRPAPAAPKRGNAAQPRLGASLNQTAGPPPLRKPV